LPNARARKGQTAFDRPIPCWGTVRSRPIQSRTAFSARSSPVGTTHVDTNGPYSRFPADSTHYSHALIRCANYAQIPNGQAGRMAYFSTRDSIFLAGGDPGQGRLPAGIERLPGIVEVDNDRRMIGRSRLALARLPVDLRPYHPLRHRLGDIEQVDPHALVAVE